ncbi:coiled-coil domain-containing protein [Sporosarcina sp. CAU 1771]
MPAISKIRFTNVVYENGDKRYNDELFLFDGHNGAIVLENGGGKTVFIQTALQAIIPHVEVANRKMKDTLRLDEGPAHIAIEWILSERPRRYGLTCVTLFMTKDSLDSLKYVYEYSSDNAHSIENLPFVRGKRPAEKGEMQDYYSQMDKQHMNAHTFDTIGRYSAYLEENFHIVTSEWESIVKINSGEGDVERFFDDCRTTGQLVDRLLIPNIEDGMAGFESTKFATSFESRLTSFQEYKHFQDKLGEYRKIQSRLDELTNHFERMEQKRTSYMKSKMTAKAYALQTDKEHAKYVDKQIEVDKAREEFEDEKKALSHREKSLSIAVERAKLKDLEEELSSLQKATRQAEEKWRTNREQLAELRLADQLQQQEVLSSRIKRLLQELNDWNERGESEDALEQFQEVGRQLAGAFEKLQAELEKERTNKQLELRQIKNIVQQEKESIEVLQKNIEVGRLDEQREITTISILENEMEQIEKDVLLDKSHTSMEEQQKQWVEEHAKLDGQIIELKNRNTQLRTLVEKATKEREDQQQPLENLRTRCTEKKMHVKEIENEEQLLIDQLQKSSIVWANLHSIYDRQESIDQSMQEDIVRLTGQFEMLLADERSATRLYDDYKEQQRFFADAFLDVQLARWQNQFTYLQTGIEFVMSLDIESTLEEDYPFWAMAVVTTEKEAPLLIEKLQNSQKELQFPVHILTLDEATSIVKEGQTKIVDWITPEHWTTALDNDAFGLWKEEIQKKAEAALETRKNFSLELEGRKRLYEAFQYFIKRYPLVYKQELDLELNELQRKEFQLSQWMSKTNVQIADYQQEMENNRNLIEKLSSEMQGFTIYLEKAKDYLDKNRRKAEHEKTKMHYGEEITAFVRQKKRVERHLLEREEDVREMEDLIRQTEAQLAKEVIDHPLFWKVKNLQALPTEQPIKIIIEEYEELEQKVAGLLSERNVVERELQSARDQLDGIALQIESLTQEYPTILKEGIDFPSNGKEQIRTFTALSPQLEVAKKEAEEVEKGQQRKVNRQEGVVEAKESEVLNPVEFHQALPIEKQELQDAWKAWRQSFDSLEKDRQYTLKQVEHWRSVKEMLQTDAVIHQFLLEEIQVEVLSEKDLLDFTYNAKKRIEEVLLKLRELGQAFEVESKRIENERLNYISFCRSTITDSRLQQTAVQGIETKSSYDEMLHYKELLEKRLHTAEQYAEQHIHTHDKELELFLRHMSMHIRALRTELLTIPKKTGVKIEDSWRQIFHITVPEWNENEGKQLLRSHVNWILAQLELEEYRADDGELDEAKVRTRLERWLNSRQLLQVVLQNKAIRISCHKVTNDNKISRAAFTWEESNSWSGGEKWSKNMSLFLGLLNYVAEKKQHIQPNMKRHRSVILDNPFGKASSGHVLTPVFFIAEQLGFQIITLTAHAEGKFLRDFFPVVYSCRLRQAVGSDRQVMTTNKTIQSAYLRDLEPDSLERLNEVEQIELFELS